MSNPYTFYIENLRVVVYAPTKAEATRIFVDSMRKNYAKVRADAIEEMFSKTDKLTVYYAGDKDGNAITPKMLVKEDVIKLLEQLKSQNRK